MCIVIDLDVVCLICLQPNKNMHPIFTADGDDPELQVAQKISILSELKTDQDKKTLPNKICGECFQDLKAAWRFRKNCQAAVTIFQTIVKLDDVQTENAATMKLAEEQIKVPHGLQIKRITIDNKGEEGENANESLNNEETATEDHFVIKNEKVGPIVYEEVECDNYEESQDSDNHEFQALDKVDENNEQNEEFEDENESFVEFYIADGGTTDESTTNIYTKDDIEEKRAKTKKHAIDMQNQQKDMKTCLQKSSKASSSGRTRSQTQLPKNINHQTSNVIQTKSKGVVIVDGTNSNEETSRFEIRQVKTRKRKSLSPEIKTPRICELCGNSYRYQHALNAHMRRHNNDKPFPCECCDKAFVSNVELRRHMRVHTGQKPYACKYCERRFSDFGSRIKHERTHTGERPYHCITCGKSFAYPHVLSVHVLTHTGEKRFCCEYCTKGFTKKVYLLSHIKQHHSGPKITNDDTMDNSRSHTYQNDTFEEIEQYDEDSFQDPGEVVITNTMTQQKIMEVDDESEIQEVEGQPGEFTIIVR